MIDARTFSLLEDRTPLSALQGRLSVSDPQPYYDPIAGRMAGEPTDPEMPTAREGDALQWIAALSALGGIIGQVLAAKKRKQKRSGVVISGEARPTRIDVPEEDISRYLPGGGRAAG